MPKIIEHLRENLLAEARRQIAERGYAGTTVRSVADACHVGVGTVYNYFPSKDMLIAGFMAEDWQAKLGSIAILPADDPEGLLRGIYSALVQYADSHQALFADQDAVKVSSVGFAARHKKLREQLAHYIQPICSDTRFADRSFAAEFIAESLICWAMEDKDFDTVYGVLSYMIQK